jgi:hypothetical protein
MWRTLAVVQRLFTMFPPGLPGLALLLLRASVGIALIGECSAHRSDLSIWIDTGAIGLSVLLWLGYLTPIAAALTLALHVLIWCTVGPEHVSVVLIILLDTIALSLLGPGVYSLDGFRFGRRVLVLPPDPTSKSQR